MLQLPLRHKLQVEFSPPTGGTLVISDPMNRPGSAFGWAHGNGQDGQCSFENGGYHVSGQCSAYGPENIGGFSIPAKFVFEIHLVAGQNCGGLDFFNQSAQGG